MAESDCICIEPWQNLPDAADGVQEFGEKPGVQCLQPGQTGEYLHTIRYC